MKEEKRKGIKERRKRDERNCKLEVKIQETNSEVKKGERRKFVD